MTIESRRVKETLKEGKGSKRVCEQKISEYRWRGEYFFLFLGGGGRLGQKVESFVFKENIVRRFSVFGQIILAHHILANNVSSTQCCGSGSAFNLPSGFGSSNGMRIRIRIQLLKHQRQKHKNTTISKVLNEQIQFISMFLLFTIICIQ